MVFAVNVRGGYDAARSNASLKTPISPLLWP